MTMYCGVCFNLGKPESVFKSHYVRKTRDKNSETTCPELLNKKCGYCGIMGHTVSHCQEKAKIDRLLAKEKKQQDLQEKRLAAPKVVKVEKVANIFNPFDALCDSDNDDDYEDIHPNVTVRDNKKKRSWAELMNDSDSDEE